MNRKISFRGKDTMTGEWRYGDLVHNQKVTATGLEPRVMVGGYEVVPETVGQFTGLLEKNGKEIYEGDILHVPETVFNGEIIGVVDFNEGAFVCKSIRSGACSDLAWAVRKRMIGEPVTEIIGNIHDNPELLKGGVL